MKKSSQLESPKIFENQKIDGLLQLFADTAIQYAGQVVGVIIAETQQLADKAAELVVVTLKDKRTPACCVKDCAKNGDTKRFTLEKEKAGVTPKRKFRSNKRIT